MPQSNPLLRQGEDEELIVRARVGDEIALRRLLTRYRPMAIARARSQFLVGADRDDLVQEAMIGLYQAIRDFDDRRGMSFRGFAELCVTRQLADAIRGAGRHKHRALNSYVSFSDPAGGAQGAETVVDDLVPMRGSGDPADIVIARERLRSLQLHVREALSELETQVLRLHIEGGSHQQIADRLQRQAKSVDNTLQRIRRKVEGHLMARELAEAG